MKTTKEKINGQLFDVNNATAEDEVNTKAICRICGCHCRRYVIEEGVVCVPCLKNT